MSLDVPLPDAAARYRPFDPGPFRMAMALTAAAERDWLEFGGDHAEQMRERRRLVAARRAEVVACLPDGEAAARELADMLLAHLCAYHPARFERSGGLLRDRVAGAMVDPAGDPLALCAVLVQEDFCLMRAHPDGHRLDAAVLCFPGRWSLAEKLGQPLAVIHGDVPFYGDRLAHPVERFFASLKPGRLAQRVNWSILTDPALFQPTGHGKFGTGAALGEGDALSSLYLRVERQTFRRLPVSQAVVFGIRTHVTRLDRVAVDAGQAARLAAALRALPPEMAEYKSTARFSAALLAALDAASGENIDDPVITA